MILLIDHKQAAINPGTTIDYISSNLLFSDREDFSLTFTLPLRGCKQNREIFSNIYRKDVDITTLYYDAEIVAGRFRSSGAVAVVEVNDDDIKLQYLGGRSFINFYPEWDDLYIDELDLGSYSTAVTTPADVWGDTDEIALPWVNNTSGNMQNRADKVNGAWQFHTTADDDEDTEVVHGLSKQIRLYKITELILDAVGYTDRDFTAWEDSEYYHLYMLNTLPSAWSNGAWAAALPHWTINEYFEELEKLMQCVFDIDHKFGSVKFSFQSADQTHAGERELREILDEFTVTVSKDDDSDYKGTQNIGYASCSHEMWNFMQCEWYFRSHPNVHPVEYQTLQGMLTHLHNDGPTGGRSSGGRISNDKTLMYAADVDTYFVLYEQLRRPTDESASFTLYGSGWEVRPINRFGDWIGDDENWRDKEEIKAVPAWLDLAIDADYNSKGRILFLECGSLDNMSNSGHTGPHGREEAQEQQKEVNQRGLNVTLALMRGDPGDKGATFDKIYVGFWYGEPQIFGDKLPCPFIDLFEIESSWDYVDIGNDKHKIVGNYTIVNSGHDGSLRINNASYSMGPSRDTMTKIEKTKKYEFSFISEELPNVRAKFLIRGKWYLCSEMQCEITSDGMSKVMKGTFWRILDEEEDNS